MKAGRHKKQILVSGFRSYYINKHVSPDTCFIPCTVPL